MLDCDDVNKAANILHTTINYLLNSCLPIRTVKMSTRDSIWMTPLVKRLLQRKHKLVARGKIDQADEVREWRNMDQAVGEIKSTNYR